ncbi:cell shape determination protein CcmA [Candidatus Marinamargulisbacteria bacterium SCGC AG-414-C22]|nr:cell shape determination protein CcmA [Candidatus Marinamargulisbacteria bacterium SCGC AG-414-C22]
MKKNKKYNSEIVNTVIGEDSSIKGTVHTQQSIRVEGTFEGEINSQGEVYIGVNSHVKATVFGRHVIVAGEVVGDIEAIKSLQITKTGKVYGNISGDQLMIEEGGIYKGKVNMDVISSKNTYEGELKLSPN